MEAICENCNYLGALMDSDELVCSRNNLKVVELDDACDDYVQGVCESCGNEDMYISQFSPDDKPYIIRTEYSCKTCKNFWYIDI